jgi:hypothetical protein
MVATIKETRDSPKLKGMSLERRYVVSGTESAAVARLALLDGTSVIDGYLVREDATVEPLDGALDLWDGKVTWGPADEGQGGTALPPTFRFSTSGGKAKMIASYEVVGAYGTDVSPSDCAGLIGGKPDGSVEGIEVEAPGFSWQETWYPPLAKLTWPYALKVRNLTACVNAFKFRAFAAGEVLFLYCEGGKKDEETGELTFHFASNPNATGLTVGSITDIAKGGWEYMDVKTKPVKVIVNGTERLFPQPYAVYVHRVFRTGNFKFLGIG